MPTEARPNLSPSPSSGGRAVVYRVVRRYWASVLVTLAVLIVVLAGATAGLTLRRQLARARPAAEPAVSTGLIRVDVAPSDALVKIDGQVQDVRQEFRLPLGSHTVSAVLDGYDAVERTFDVRASDNPPVELRLTPKALSVRLLVRLSGADVVFDGQKVEASSDDWFVVPNVNAGAHTVEVRYAGAPVWAKVNFLAAPGGVSSIQGPIEAKGGTVLAMSYAPGNKSQLVTSSGPAYVTVAGERFGPMDRNRPVEAALAPGDLGVVLEEGGRKDTPYPVTVGAGPFLALFLRADVSQISLDVQPPDATVLLERQGKALRGVQRRRWIFANLEPGEYLVRAQKEGFGPAEKRIVLGKGTHLLERIVLVEKPKKSTLEITGIPAGLNGSVLVDDKPVGSLSPAGFRYDDIGPGQRTIRLVVRNHDSEPLARSFAAGGSVQFSLTEFKLRKRYGKLDFRGVEPAANLTLTLIDEKSGRRETKRVAELAAREVPLEFDVDYTVRFEAPGYKAATRKVLVRDAPNETQFYLGRFTLEEIPKPAVVKPPPRQAETLPGWDNANVWAADGEGWKQYKAGSSVGVDSFAGTITFEIKFRGSAKWQVDFGDSKNSVAIELKKDRLTRRRTNAGKKEREKSVDFNGPAQEYRRVRIVLRGDVLEHAIFDNGQWKVVDELDGNSAGNGRFVLSLNNRTFVRNFEYLAASR